MSFDRDIGLCSLITVQVCWVTGPLPFPILEVVILEEGEEGSVSFSTFTVTAGKGKEEVAEFVFFIFSTNSSEKVSLAEQELSRILTA